MMRNLAALAALAAFAAAAAPASALNPQPLPPKSLYLNKYGNVMLNPQPLPPRYKLYYLHRR
jgi:hypothetical protein